jgi:hypothetical protein
MPAQVVPPGSSQVGESSSSVMDPITRGLLDELEGLLSRKVITRAEWREDAAAVLREAEEQRQ